jgi:hypothetical protein
LHLLRLGGEYVTDAEFRHIFELSCEKGFRAIIDLDFAAAANEKKEIATATRIGVFSSRRFIARGALEGMHRHDAFPLASGTHHTRRALLDSLHDGQHMRRDHLPHKHHSLRKILIY